MNTTKLKKSLHHFIDQADERFLRMVHSLAKEYTKDQREIIACRAGESITKEKLYQELKEAEQEIENGDYISLEEFEKESSKWE